MSGSMNRLAVDAFDRALRHVIRERAAEFVGLTQDQARQRLLDLLEDALAIAELELRVRN